MKPTAVLQDWSIIITNPNPYAAPEAQKCKLHGKVYGHPDFPDGTEVTTSTILNKIDDETYETRSRIYKLGSKDPDYLLHLQQYNSEV